jgi:hypothetical protein
MKKTSQIYIDPRFESETDMSFSENEPMAESLADAFKVQSLDNSDNVSDSCDEISVLCIKKGKIKIENF